MDAYPQAVINGTNNSVISYFPSGLDVPQGEFVTTLSSGYSTDVIDTGDGCRLNLLHIKVVIKSVSPSPVSSSTYSMVIDATTANPTNFNSGANFVMGQYTVTYQTGAWEWAVQGSNVACESNVQDEWTVGTIIITDGSNTKNSGVHGGSCGTGYSSAAAAIAAAPPGTTATWWHVGNRPIGCYAVDTNYSDNINGSPSPTMQIQGPAPYPAILFYAQTSDDAMTWFDAAASEDGSVSGPDERFISLTTRRRYVRLAWREVGQTDVDPGYFPPGAYILSYITGAYDQGGGAGWSPAATITTGTTTEGTTDHQTSGPSTASEAACEAYYAGYQYPFPHYGGAIGIKCADSSTVGNVEGSPPATWLLQGTSSVTFLYALALTTIE